MLSIVAALASSSGGGGGGPKELVAEPPVVNRSPLSSKKIVIDLSSAETNKVPLKTLEEACAAASYAKGSGGGGSGSGTRRDYSPPAQYAVGNAKARID